MTHKNVLDSRLFVFLVCLGVPFAFLWAITTAHAIPDDAVTEAELTDAFLHDYASLKADGNVTAVNATGRILDVDTIDMKMDMSDAPRLINTNTSALASHSAATRWAFLVLFGAFPVSR